MPPASGAPNLLALDSAFTHHGSITDPGTGLQLKGERWYSSDLGRFISEDPIQDGSNWYMFAGNDPVNFADPSGLSQQGYPLAGGYSGNVTTAPTIRSGNITANNLGLGPALSPGINSFLKGAVSQAINPTSFPSTIFGGFVGADRAQQILGLGPVATPGLSSGSSPSYAMRDLYNSLTGGPSLTINDFSLITDLSSITRGNASFPGALPSVDPRFEGVVEGMRAQAFWDHLDNQLRDNRPGGKYDFRRNSTFLDDPLQREIVDLGTSVTPGVSDIRDLKELATGRDAVSGSRMSWYAYGTTAVAAVLPFVGGGTLRRLFGVGAVEQSRNALGQFAAKNSGEVAPGVPRQQYVQGKLVGRFGAGAVQPEQYLRTADGKIAIDPVTGEGRRLDFAIVRNGQAVGTVEVTSKTANKKTQQAKELNVRSGGGTYIQDRTTGQLIDFSNAPHKTSRRR